MKKSIIKKYIDFYTNKLGKEVLEYELRIVESKLKNCKNILSVGCGPAFLETSLYQLHPDLEVTGIDNSKGMIVQASKSIHAELGDAQHLMFNNDIFDAVLYVTSLEFISNYRKSIREAHRVLKPKGKLLILMLNPKSLYFKDEYSDKNSYIRKNIRNTDVDKIKSFVSQYFLIVEEECCLGIKDMKIFNSSDPQLASLNILEGMKVGK
jgi:ubiquinone/menaquinone biosynthesis C-methylase UbiE